MVDASGKLKVGITGITIAHPYIAYRFMAIQSPDGHPGNPAIKAQLITLKPDNQNSRAVHESVIVIGDISKVKAEMKRDHTTLSSITLSGDMNALSIDETSVTQTAVTTQKTINGVLTTLSANTVILYKLTATGAPDM